MGLEQVNAQLDHDAGNDNEQRQDAQAAQVIDALTDKLSTALEKKEPNHADLSTIPF